MEGVRRMFFFRDCIRGVKIPVVIAVWLVQKVVVVMYITQVTVTSRGLSEGGLVMPGFFTIIILSIAVWVVFAVIVNRLKGDPYYSFEFIPTMAMVSVSLIIILSLILENSPELLGGSDVWSQSLNSLGSLSASLLSIPIILTTIVALYIFGSIGSAIALLFSGDSSVTASVGGWARGVADDFQGLSEGVSKQSPSPPPQGAADGQAVPQQPRPASAAPNPPATAPVAVLDEGQVAARAAWQTVVEGHSIYCRKCGSKSAIWDPVDFCGHCGQIRGVPAPEAECIEQCGAKVGKKDKFCFRCGVKQPV